MFLRFLPTVSGGAILGVAWADSKPRRQVKLPVHRLNLILALLISGIGAVIMTRFASDLADHAQWTNLKEALAVMTLMALGLLVMSPGLAGWTCDHSDAGVP